MQANFESTYWCTLEVPMSLLWHDKNKDFKAEEDNVKQFHFKTSAFSDVDHLKGSVFV